MFLLCYFDLALDIDNKDYFKCSSETVLNIHNQIKIDSMINFENVFVDTIYEYLIPKFLWAPNRNIVTNATKCMKMLSLMKKKVVFPIEDKPFHIILTFLTLKDIAQFLMCNCTLKIQIQESIIYRLFAMEMHGNTINNTNNRNNNNSNNNINFIKYDNKLFNCYLTQKLEWKKNKQVKKHNEKKQGQEQKEEHNENSNDVIMIEKKQVSKQEEEVKFTIHDVCYDKFDNLKNKKDDYLSCFKLLKIEQQLSNLSIDISYLIDLLAVLQKEYNDFFSSLFECSNTQLNLEYPKTQFNLKTSILLTDTYIASSNPRIPTNDEELNNVDNKFIIQMVCNTQLLNSLFCY